VYGILYKKVTHRLQGVRNFAQKVDHPLHTGCAVFCEMQKKVLQNVKIQYNVEKNSGR
jgi:hypothetical protein